MTPSYDEERLGELLRLMRPAPEGWMQAAQELPLARKTLDEIVARAQADLEFRAALIADLESALAQAGYEPSALVVDELRQHLAER